MGSLIKDFEKAPIARGVFYGGNAGAKEAVIFNDNVWMVKYPKTTRDLLNPQISYTTSPLSEYLGSKIYELLGLPVHEVMLGVRKNKIVVACKDFTRQTDDMLITAEAALRLGVNKELEGALVPLTYIARTLIPFHDLKNSFMSSDLDEYSGTGSETFLDEVLATIQGEAALQGVDGVLERFWDMFVIDAFIGNNDRNNGNWGLLWNHDTGVAELTPVYDNGNAFFNKRSLKQMEKRLTDEEAMKQDAYGTLVCVYKYTGLDNEGHQIHPFRFIRETEDLDCKAAVMRFLERVDMNEIRGLIESIPESIGNLSVMPNIQKEFYKELLTIRLAEFKGSVDDA